MTTVLYGVNCVSVQSGMPSWPVVLGISGTPKAIALHCFVPVDDVMWRTKIFECKPQSIPFLCTLFFGVQLFLTETIYTEQPIRVYQPISDKQFEVVDLSKPRVLKYNNMLYKLFDSQDICQRRDNMDLLLALDLVHEIEYLSLDNCFCLLSRPFIEGSHHPSNLSDFIGAVTCLKQVHELGYIHADIRLNNIVFTLEGRSHLIDFDLAVPVGQHKYPKGYAFLRERHRDTKEGNIVKKEHDIYSMRKVITDCFECDAIESCKTLDEMLRIVGNSRDWTII